MEEVLDAIQSRYGWTDAVVYALTWKRWCEIRDVINRVRKEDAHERLVVASFQAWQVLGGAGVPFGEYLSKLGLGDKPAEGTKPEAASLTAAEALAKAEAILEKARRSTSGTGDQKEQPGQGESDQA